MNNLKFFDFEVLPEWWCVVVSDEEETYPGGSYNNQFTDEDEARIKSKMRIYTSDDVGVVEKLRLEVCISVLCGYNIKHYDLMILKCVLAGMTPRKVHIASEILIHPELATFNQEYGRIASFIKSYTLNEVRLLAEAWQDLMDDNDMKSLKDKECSLGMDIRETTVPFDKVDLTPEDKDNIIFYCKHDVYALHVYYVTVSKAYIDTKVQLSEIFNLTRKTAFTNTNANLAGLVLGAERKHGTALCGSTISIEQESFRDYIYKWLPIDILNHLLTTKEGKTFMFCDNDVSIGDGGLHSVYHLNKIGRTTPGLYIESTDEYSMYNVDVSSCYPSVMLFGHSMSRAITKPERFHYIYKRRVDLKAIVKSKWTQDDKKFVGAGKLVLNTTYGAMGNEHLSLYDDYMRSRVCRIGQMILLSIMNKMYTTIPGLKVIQTNTDGILVYTKRSNYDKIAAIVQEFTDISSFLFEIEEDNKLWQLNVNNYVAIHPDGEIKNKGGSFVDTVYQPGTNKIRPLGNFVVQKAQMAFYTKGANPVQYLLDNKSISDLCLTCTKGGTFKSMVQFTDKGEIELGRVSRVVAITDESLGVIKKLKFKDGVRSENTIPNCPEHPLVVNDNLQHYFIENGYIINKLTKEKHQLDYAYYARLLDDVLDIPWMELKNETLRLTEDFNL